MKKQFLFLAGSAIILASCGSNNNNQPPAQTQAQIDSAMNAKLAEHDAANAAKNDSTLKAIEKEKADAAMKEHHADGKKHDGHKDPAPAPTPTVAPQQSGPRSHAAPSNSPATAQPGAPAGGPRSHAAEQNKGK